MNIYDYGWNEKYEIEWKKKTKSGMFPGRVVTDYGQMVRVFTDSGELMAKRPVSLPGNEMQIAAGDWAALKYEEDNETLSICFVLERKTKFSRAAAGTEVREQIVAANIDTIFIMQSLNRDFNMKRLERYLIAAWESGAVPVVVLTKTDCCDDVEKKIKIAEETALGVEIHAVSNVTGEGIGSVKEYFKKGETIALLGSSGVGKTTFVNILLGEEVYKTNTIREDDSKGRHTTTSREIILVPGGGMVLDTPGMREFSLWEADEGMEKLYGDIEDIIEKCRFNDCSHGNEPGCSVREALGNGTLDIKRWEGWMKLQKELEYIKAKKDFNVRQREKDWGRQLSRFKKELKRK